MLFFAANLIFDLRENFNIFCSIVVYPVIPKGQMLLRLIPTADHTDQDVDDTLHAFREIYRKLTTGEYDKQFEGMAMIEAIGGV